MRFVGRRASRAANATLRNQKLESSDNGGVNAITRVALSSQPTQLSLSGRWSFRHPVEDYELVSFQDEPLSLLTDPPSLEEVTDAVSALSDELGRHARHVDGVTCQQVCAGDDVDWMEPSPTMFYPLSLETYRARDVNDAFHLLKTDPTIKKMVLSLSSDPVVWDAVLNNEVVRDLREKYFKDEKRRENSNSVLSVLKCILEGAKAKLVELYKNIAKVIEDVIKPTYSERVYKGFDEFDDMMRISFFLSIFVLLVVVITRSQRCC